MSSGKTKKTTAGGAGVVDMLQSLSSVFTPTGLRMATDLLGSKSVLVGGRCGVADAMYDAYKAQTGGGGGGAPRPSVQLSPAGEKKLRAFLTSRRVLRGGESIADTFLKVVSPAGFERIQSAVTGGRGPRVRSLSQVRVAQRGAGSGPWPFQSSLPEAASVGALPRGVAATVSPHMQQLSGLLNSTPTPFADGGPTAPDNSWLPGVLRGATTPFKF